VGYGLARFGSFLAHIHLTGEQFRALQIPLVTMSRGLNTIAVAYTVRAVSFGPIFEFSLLEVVGRTTPVPCGVWVSTFWQFSSTHRFDWGTI